MGVRERILAIRLTEKLSVRPAYAQALGLVAANTPVRRNASNSAESKP